MKTPFSRPASSQQGPGLRIPQGRVSKLSTRFLGTAVILFTVVICAIMFMMVPHGRPTDVWLRYLVPGVLVAFAVPALWLVRSGRPSAAATIYMVLAYLGITLYATLGQYGVRNHSLAIYGLVVVLSAFLQGRAMALFWSVVTLVTVWVLYGLEVNGLVVIPGKTFGAPLINVALTWSMMLVGIGGASFVFSKIFYEVLHKTDDEEERIRQIMELVPLGYLVHRDGRILMVNQSATRQMGLKGTELVGQELSNVVPAAHHPRMDRHLRKAATLRTGESISKEFTLESASGSHRQIEATTTGLDFVDGPALLTQLRDVTRERRITQALQKAKADAEAANLAKSQFLANMSHEIRTPMNAVLGLSDILVRSGINGQPLQYAQNIHTAAASLLSLINDVLDVSRIEEGAVMLDIRPFSLQDMFRQIGSTLGPLADARNLTLRIELEPTLPPVLMGDSHRLRQVVMNLAGNAIKFTESGEVRIGVRRIPRDDVLEGLCIAVTDTGVGIAAEQLPHLFERFVQVDASNTRRHGGSGLGLYIVRELVRHMGGTVQVHSQPGQGSTFEVCLGLEAPTDSQLSHWGDLQAPESAEEEATPPAAALSILVVEDHEINRIVARSLLEAAGHRVMEATNGEEALRCLEAQRFDCVLMDIQMPVMDGLQATQQLRTMEQTSGRARTPVVALTANTMQGDRERYLAAGMDGFLAKPYDKRTLLAAVESVLPKTPAITP